MSTLAATWIGAGQGWRQIEQLVLAFGLSTVVGLEREFRGKSAGLRTQAIVGTTSALILLVSKYGFSNVLAPGAVVLDPSRVAAQIVSGIGFLGAGLIITRRGAIQGLTTAAAVWETAAIGMAAGAGLEVLAVSVTVLHFVAVLGFTPLGRMVAARGTAERGFTLTYRDGAGVLRDVLAACTRRGVDCGVTHSRGRPLGRGDHPTGGHRCIIAGRTRCHGGRGRPRRRRRRAADRPRRGRGLKVNRTVRDDPTRVGCELLT
ncbi:hypothetical protein GCM10009648_21550 [Tsukamurella spumae]